MRLDVQSVTVRLGRATVLDGVDLVARPGEVTALLGPNGCGKTTLMRAVADLVPHAGRIAFDGGERRAGVVGYMAQDMAQRAALTVLEVVLLGRLGGLGWRVSPEDLGHVDRALAAVGLADLADRPIADLSGGQRQLVQFAQLLVRQPAVALLDEPTSALDLRHQLLLLELVRRETAARGMTTLVSLHDLSLALAFADRVVVLHLGRQVANGAPADVLTPALVREVYGVDARILPLGNGRSILAPIGAAPQRDRPNPS